MPARSTWLQIEPIHAITYFSEESIRAARESGLRGFWMGYFGFRACPLGPVEPGVVEAAFANFAPAMVGRAIPDAWRFAEPAHLLAIRAQAAGAALRKVSEAVEPVAVAVNESLEAVIAAASSIGRPLFAANRDVSPFADPVQRLWQNCTTLREHRGDGHVAALTAAGIDGPQAHLLLAAEHGWAPEVFFDSRGWDAEQRESAGEQLVERGLLSDEGLTHEGAALRVQVEEATDARAAEPYEAALASARWQEVIHQLQTVAASVVGRNSIPFPNPMGLPAPDSPNR